jgi:hypothetical protein
VSEVLSSLAIYVDYYDTTLPIYMYQELATTVTIPPYPNQLFKHNSTALSRLNPYAVISIRPKRGTAIRPIRTKHRVPRIEICVRYPIAVRK